MSEFEETFKALLSRWMTANIDAAVQVIDYEQDTEAYGYCETCYGEDTIVRIVYVRASGDRGEYTYYGDMGELIRALSDFDTRESE